MARHYPKQWDAIYDVVVLGYGGAGATAARFAADNGAKVLLVDSAPEGSEGGNTRVAEQFLASGDDFDGLKQYETAMNAPFHVDDDVVDTLVHGMVNMYDYVEKYLGVPPFSYKKQFNGKSVAVKFLQEYPELPGASAYDMITVQPKYGQAALWKLLKKEVDKRSDKIDVWYSSPARHLIQDPETKTVIGAQIERDHVLRSIKARNGVVLTTGGFENSEQKVKDYLQEPYMAPVGTLYNQGAGIDMALEVGADLWHMRSYESLGFMHGLSVRTEKGKRGIGTEGVTWQPVSNGSIIAVGDDGTRYFKEDDVNRHGHTDNHGMHRVPLGQVHPYMIFDRSKADELAKEYGENQQEPPIIDFMKYAIKADSISELAKKIDKDPDKLTETISDFNFFCDEGKDYAYHRDPVTLRKFDDGPYYAVALRQVMLNTQGGPRRNSHAEILDPDGDPIPHFYGAGELGAPFVNQYSGGGNLAECLIFGKIAGENAASTKAVVKDDNAKDLLSSETTSDFVVTSDDKKKATFTTGPNQYIGRSKAGMGDELVVRVTVGPNKSIENVEVLQESETEHGSEALREMPKRMVEANTYEVDAVSSASSTSNALRDAVKDAVSQVK